MRSAINRLIAAVVVSAVTAATFPFFGVLSFDQRGFG